MLLLMRRLIQELALTDRSATIKHAMTVDVEDYFHVAAFSDVIEVDKWSDYACRVENNTKRLLELFDHKGIKATFFVLGWVAERYPELIKEISTRGHELASHGYSHQLVYSQTPEVFKEETRKSKQILEDISGQEILGYRAASYSITGKSLWALDILAELGFTWDSSIFPIRHDNYGMPNSPEQPYQINTRHGALKEFPLTTAKVLGLSVPAAGGGYFRQYPYFLSKYLFNRASLNQTKPQIFYLHPWEIDAEQPRVEGASWFSRFRHYTNLKRCMPRLEQLIDDFEFSTISESLENVDVSISRTVNQLV
jgi:polysaccharide deacetylase family protein (PEP-CTERM system associated)